MAMSIYYTAIRKRTLDKEERERVQSIVDMYCAKFPFENKHEDFCLYKEPFDEPNIVLDGATRIPWIRSIFYDVIVYWLKCLTELTMLLSDCEWKARLDNVSLIWEGGTGWRLPTDEEYAAAKRKQS